MYNFPTILWPTWSFWRAGGPNALVILMFTVYLALTAIGHVTAKKKPKPW